MKQTNNAIKFLMAQYRAIFRNANLKMFLAAATAAAALSATQAKAADFDNNALGTTGAGEVVIEGTTLEKINMSGGASSEKAFDIKLKKSTGDSVIKGDVSLANSTLTVSGASLTDAKLNIGKGAAKATEVTLKALEVSEKGQLDVEGTSANKTTVSAGTISFGNGKTTTDSVVNIGADSTVKAVGDTPETGILTINKATVTVSGGGTLSGKSIQVTDGAITLGDSTAAAKAGTLGSDTASVVMESGTITVAANTAGAINGSTITLNDGTIDTSGTLTLGKEDATFTMNGGTISNKTGTGHLKVASNAQITGGTLDIQSGDATFSGKAIFGADSKISLGAGAKLVLTKDSTIDTKADNITPNATGKLEITNAAVTMSAASLKKFLTGEVHSTTGGNTATIKFSDAKVDLDDLAIQTSNGNLNGNFKENSDSFFAFEGAEASFKGAAIDANTTLTFDTLTVGADGAFEIKGGADLYVGKTLALHGDKGDGITVTSGSVVLNGDGGSIDAKAITLKNTTKADNAKLSVNPGKWTIKDLVLDSGSAQVSGAELTVSNLTVKNGGVEVVNGANLKIAGNLATTDTVGYISGDASVINTIGGGTVSLGTAGVKLSNTASLKLEAKDFHKEADGNKSFDASKLKDAVTASVNSTLTIMDGDAKLSMTGKEFDELRTAIGTDFKGSIDVNVTGAIDGVKPGMALNDVKDGLAADAYKDTYATQDAATAVSGNKTIGSVELTGNGSELKLDANGAALGLYSAKDGKFVYTKDADGKTTAAGVTFGGTENSLTLVGTGEIGAITNGHSAAAGTLTIGTAEKNGTVTVNGGIGAADQDKGVDSVTVNANSHLNVDGGVYTNNLDLRQGTSLNAKDGAGDVIVSGTATILGDIDAKALNLSGAGAHSIAGNSEITADALTLAANSSLTVGDDGDENGSGSTSASVFVDVLSLGAGSSLIVDPQYGQAASLVVANSLDANKTGIDAGVLSGDVFVGKNAAVGIGFPSGDEFKSAMSDYLVYNGGFSDAEGAVKNAFVLDKQITVATNKKIVLDATKTLDELKKLGNPDTLTLGAGSALIVSDAATSGPNAAINFTNASATVDAATGSEVILVGDYNKNSSVNLFKANNGTGTVTIKNDIKLSAAGGLLEAVVAAGAYGTPTQLTTVDGYEGIARAGVAGPVGQVFVDYVDGNLKFVPDSLGHDFLVESMQTAQGRKAFDAAAHAATYAGAQQAAVAAVGTMAEAVGGRVGSMGVEAATISATGSQANGGVWLSPMYKSVDADGFNAEGASYGADVDLAGVAFGADTVNGNMRFGAVFNIGSGDADGKGNGNGLKDEFDYYGFGMYTVMGFGNLALVGDASLNVISHDVEGLGAKGSADTTAVTMGVTGQYTISNPAVDVTPHVGARFIRLDTDSYDLNTAEGVLAKTDFDVQNVFSIPLGVTLSKAFEMGGWSLAPSADLSITFNTGDTEVKSTTAFNGIQPFGLTSEVLDEVTYGVAVGLGAQYGAFGTQIGINYTGSENTDALGVNAQARYMF